MKTSDEIKKGLENCTCVNASCESCPFRTGTGCECIRHMSECALSYIQKLENHIGELTEKVEQLETAQPKWVSAANPPEKWHMDDEDKTFINYLVVGPDYGVDIGNYVKPAKMWVVMGLPAKVTHWMTMPEPPEVVQKHE